MSKQFFQDMVKIKRQQQEQASGGVRQSNIENIKTEQIEIKPPEQNFRYRLWVVAGVSVLFLLFSFSFLFSGATVTLEPRIEELALNQNFSAVKDGAEDDLPFDLVIISGEESKNVEGGEEKDISLKATGLVVVYNAFGSAPQRLDIDTRLEGSNGKMYKTKRQITVPGLKGSTPGSVEVEIYGTEAGEAYNSAPLDFKIFGFKGTPKYSKFYARSKGEIKGGFIGKQRQVSETDKTAALKELQANLKAKLLQKATDQTPSGFVLFKDAGFLSIDEENFNSASESSIVPVSIKGTLYGILFEEKPLTQKIIEKSFPGEETNEIYIQNIQDLTFSIPNGTAAPYQKNILENVKTVNFNLSGISNAVWRIDEDKLLGDILGKKKKDFNQTLAQYPNIVLANLSLRPFWKRSLPDDAEDVKVVVSYPE